MRHWISCLVFFQVLFASAGAEAGSTTQPSVPQLTVGQSPNSFVAAGLIRLETNHGLAFHVAVEGNRQRCSLYDPADGTPLFISDGEQTLIYDLANSRVVIVKSSRGAVRLTRNPASGRFAFNFSVDFKSKNNEFDEPGTTLRIDQIVSTLSFTQPDSEPNSALYVAEDDKSIATLQLARADLNWFRFALLLKGEDQYRLIAGVQCIDQPVPESALKFPDVKRFPPELRVIDPDEQVLPKYVELVRNGLAWFAKLSVAAGSDFAKSTGAAALDVDLDALRERDKKLGTIYRAALAEQGVEFQRYEFTAATAPSTAPAR